MVRSPLARVVLACTLAGCGVEAPSPVETADARALLLVGTPVLSAPYLVRGYPANIVVSGADPGDAVTFYGSTNLTGAGVCGGGGVCLDLGSPVTTYATRTANASGVAALTSTVPANTVVQRVELQAVVRSGGAYVPSTSTTTRIYDPTDDPDADGVTMAEEITFGTDPLDSDSDDDGYDDYLEYHRPICWASSVSPDPATSADALTCACDDYTDGDGDPEGASTCAFHVDGVRVAGNACTLPAGTTTTGDSVTCTYTPRDADGTGYPATSAAIVIRGGSAPSVAVAVDPVAQGGDFVCDVQATDPDGDPLTTTYAWAFEGATLSGETTATLGNTFPRGDTVTCTATVSDGVNEVVVTSDPAESANGAPTAASIELTSTAADGTPDASDTLSCRLVGAVDADGDATSISYVWSVDGAEVLAETLDPGVESTLSDGFTKDRTVTCAATPTDGSTAGATLEDSVVVDNHVVRCSDGQITPTGRVSNTSSLTCSCTVEDLDGDYTSTSCTWQYEFEDTDVRTGCTLTGAQSPDNTDLDCLITPSDAEGPGLTSTEPTVIGQGGRTVTWTSPNVTLTPASGVAAYDDDTVLTCAWDDTAVTSSGDAPTYVVIWRVDDVPVLEDGPASATLEEIAPDAVAGDAISCDVHVGDRGLPIDDGGPGGASNVLVLEATPGAVQSLTMTPDDVVYAGDTVRCDYTLEDAGTSSTWHHGNLQWAEAADASTSSGWYDLSSANPERVVTAALAGKWVRCFWAGYLDDPFTYTNGTTDWVPVVARAPVIESIAVGPAVSDPCEERVCQLVVSDADVDLGFPIDVTVDVTWTVDGVDVGTDSGTFTLVSGSNALRVAMTEGVDSGSEVSCTAVVTKGMLSPVVVSSTAATVTGDQPVVGSVSLASNAARVGDVLTCDASVSGSCDSGAADLTYTWYADGVEVDGQTGATLDTSVLGGGEVVTCAASAGDDAGGFGAPVASSSSTYLFPNEWTITGSEAGAWAGHAVGVLGDLDGDGLAEVALGAPDADADGRASSGKVYVLPGRDGGATSLADVDDGTELGAAIHGDSGSWSAYDSICRTREPNILVPCNPGHAGFDPEGDYSAPLGDGLGTTLTMPGDLTGDGVPDLVAAAPYAFAHGQYLAGATYVVSGAELASDWPIASVGTLVADTGTRIDGNQGVWPSYLYTLDGFNDAWDGHNAGFGLSSGDFDGDGAVDLAVGAPNADGASQQAGEIYVLPFGDGLPFGWLGPLVGVTDLTGDGTGISEGRVLHGMRNGLYLPGTWGSELATTDFDGDGVDDLLVNKRGLANGRHLVLSAGVGDEVFLRDPDQADESKAIAGLDGSFETYTTTLNPFANVTSGKADAFALSMGTGDLNGDGKGDFGLAFIENEGGPSQLEVAVWFGEATDPGSDFDMNGPDQGVGGFVVEGRPAGGDLHNSVHVYTIGDVNGDGRDDLAIGASKGSSTLEEGLLYVVYGKTDTATVTLADLEAGIGGFALRNLPGMVWHASGGDVDGDGLSDIVYGMPKADGDAAASGVVKVWFGRDTTGGLTTGLVGDDALAGTTGANRMAGGRGDDTLTGNGGADVLLGGAGDDLLVVSDASFARIAGGAGYDILRISRASVDLVSKRGLVSDVEAISLQTGADLQLTSVEVLRMSTTGNELTIAGGSTSTVDFEDAGWAFDGTTIQDGATYDRLVNGNAVVLAKDGLDLRVAPRLVTTSLSVGELAASGDLVGVLVTEDVDGDVVTLSADLTGLEGILTVAADGTVRVAGVDVLDHETTPELEVPVTLTDTDGLSTVTTLVITVADEPEAPVFTVSEAESSAQEGAPANTLVAVVRATDPDVGDAVTYARLTERHWIDETTSVTNRHGLDVDPSTGRVYVFDGSYLNFEYAPEIELVVRATDSTGRSADATVYVTLADLEYLAASFTVPFLTENRGMWDSDSSITTSFSTAPIQTIDLTADLTEGDAAIQSPVDDESYPFTGTFDGSVGGDVNLEFSDGYLSAYLPVDVSILPPDGVVLGQPFDIATSWALNEGAGIWGETPGIHVEYVVDFDDVAGALSNPLFEDAFGEALNQVDASMNFDVDAIEFGGAAFDALYPGGADLVSPASTNGGLVWWTYPSHGGTADDASRDEKVLGAMLLPPDSVVGDYTNPNLLVSSYTEDEFLQLDLDLHSLLEELNIPSVHMDSWEGDAYVLLGDQGYVDLYYDLWTSNFSTLGRIDQRFAVEADDVVATLEFEGGTTFQASMATGFQDLVLPQDEDVDGDGVVSFTMDLAIDATQYKYWNYDLTLDWASDLLGGGYELWLDSYDFRTGETERVQYADISFGPMRHTDTYLTLFEDSETPSWPLLGFDVVTVTGGLQVSR